MIINIRGNGRFFRGFCDAMKEKTGAVDEILHKEVLVHLGLPEAEEVPAGAVVISLQEGYVYGKKFLNPPAIGVQQAKTAIYIELTNVTDKPDRVVTRKTICDGLVEFVKGVYRMAEYEHDAIQVKPEVVFISPSSLVEARGDSGVVVEELLLMK